MKQKTKEEAFASQTGLIPSLLFLCAIGLAIAAIFSPWFLWREPPNWLMEEQISTTDLVYLLPYVTSRGNDTIVGAQTNDSSLALGVGNAARLIILGITTLSFCLLLRNRSQRYRILISLLLLPLLLGTFAWCALNLLFIESVYSADDATLPYMVRVERSGPGLLAGALISFILAVLASRHSDRHLSLPAWRCSNR